jgi:hypothetical protein
VHKSGAPVHAIRRLWPPPTRGITGGPALGLFAQAVDEFGPGSTVTNYWLRSPKNLDIASGSYTVDRSTQLSDLLIADMGVCHWAACR